MYKNVLVPVAPDHGGHTDLAIAIAKTLREGGGKITLLTVSEQIPAYVSQYLPEGQIEKNVADAKARLEVDTQGETGMSVAVEVGNPGVVIPEYAAENGVDLIVIASHRPGLQDYFLGSTAARVVRHSGCSVHVVR